MSFLTRSISIKLGTLITWVRGSPQEIYMTLDLVVTWCHITDKTCSISSSTRPITSELGIMVTHQINSDDPFFKWLLEVKFKNVASLLQHNFWPPSLQGSRFKLRGSQLPNHITSWFQDHVENENDKDPDLFSTRFWKNKLGWEETHSKHDLQNYKYAVEI